MKSRSNGDWIRRYYLVTPLFSGLDALFGLTFRASGLASQELRHLHYGLCLLCALACYRQRRYSALIAMAESSINLLILLAGVMLAIVRLGAAAGDPVAGAVLDGNNLVNFLLSGALLPAVFYSSQDNLRTARGNH